MKIKAQSNGGLRIPNKGPVVKDESAEKRVGDYGFLSNHAQTIPTNVSSWIESSILEAIQETHGIVPENDADDWAKKNRLQALSQLQLHGYSASNICPPYNTASNKEYSTLALNHQVYPPSYEWGDRQNSMFVPEPRFSSVESDRPPMYQQEMMKPEFLHNKDFSIRPSNFQMFSGFQNNPNSFSTSDEETQLVCKSTNQKSFHEEESQSENYIEPAPEITDILAGPTCNPQPSMDLKPGYLDSHCHLDMLFNDENFNGTYTDYIALHKDSFPDNYKGCVTVFCKPLTFSKEHIWRKLLDQPDVWGAFGCHPKQAKSFTPEVEFFLEKALDHPKVCALGEIGLDYSKQNWRFKKAQHFAFKRQLAIAKRRNLRVVIHCREADDDAIKIMREMLPEDAVFHLHCFSGSWRKAQMWMDAFRNVYIGITNLVSFPSAVDTHEVAGRLPLNRLLLETDAPFFCAKRGLGWYSVLSSWYGDSCCL